MIVVGYWSYKGGTGRSLAAANTAYALSCMGKNVVVLDTDFDAPGLMYKFKGAAFNGATKAGLDGDGLAAVLWHRIVLGKDPATGPQLAHLAIRVQFPTKPKQSKQGTIFLLPAGYIGDKYWELVGTLGFSSVFSSEHCPTLEDMLTFIRGKLTEEDISGFQQMVQRVPLPRLTVNEKIQALQNLIFEIQETFDPQPDYLLIDLRGGITEVQGIAVRLWINKLIAVFVHNDEQMEAFTGIFDKIRKLTRLLDGRSIQIIPVLARIPPSLYRQIGVDAGKFMAKVGLSKDALCLIHEDRHLELADEIVLLKGSKSQYPLLYRQLCNDYIDLAARILTSSDSSEGKRWKEEKAENQRRLRTRLRIDEWFQEEQVFALYRRLGEMVNVVDNARNVSFRVDTFTTLLGNLRRHVERYIVEMRKKGELSNGGKAFAGALALAGQKCGDHFGDSLLDVWKRSRAQHPLARRVERWCEFDSIVGWGRFRSAPENLPNDMTNDFSIIVVHNFLASGKEPDLCPFMTGYIQGVLSQLLERQVKVSHSKRNCIRGGGKTRKECLFKIQLTSRAGGERARVVGGRSIC